MDKEAVISSWIRSGVRDFYLYFELEGRWWNYNAFFLHQGLEKLCKAYFLGERAAVYERLSEQKALAEIYRIVKKDLSHGLEKMILGLQKRKVVNLRSNPVDGKNWIDIIQILDKAYDQCRYPLPLQPVHRSYPMRKHKDVYEDVLGSSFLKDVAYPLARQILEGIRANFSVKFSTEKDAYNKSIDDKEWERFSRLFFKKR